MSNFCSKCGAPANGSSFCVKCGNDLRSQPDAAPVAQSPVTPAAQALPTSQATPFIVTPASIPAAPAQKKGMSTLAKVGIAVVAVFVFFGAVAIAGALYVAHRVTQKVHEVKGELLGSTDSTASTGSSSGRSSVANVCRYLSKQEVSRAIGVEIVATESTDDGCSYLAVGNSVDMTAKHVAAMARDRGADAQAQNAFQNFAAAIGKSQPSSSREETSDKNGNVPVLVVGIDDNSADEEMRLNKATVGRLPGSQVLPGIGDEAFDTGNAMMMIRKGNKFIRIMYMTCPCNTDAVKPLAQKLVASL